MMGKKKLSDYTLRVPKRALLFEAAIVWFFAGGILQYKGFDILSQYNGPNWLIAFVCLCGGVGFYFLLFTRITGKHINRIKELSRERSCLFSFFNWKGYLMMFLMISGGLMLRKSEIIPAVPLAYFYLFMGTPLLISAIRFLLTGIDYKSPNGLHL